MKPNCKLCQWIQMAASKALPNQIFESEWSIGIVGEHQYFEGYCVIVSKQHVREMHELSEDAMFGLMKDVANLGGAIDRSFKPHKINYASLGNVEEHLHWHVIPRYLSEESPFAHPWSKSDSFTEFATSSAQIEKIKRGLNFNPK